MGFFDRFNWKDFGGALGAIARRIQYESWDGARSPYGLPVPIVYGVAWVSPIQVYSGEQFNWHNGTATRTASATLMAPVFTVDDETGAISIAEERSACQSAVLVLCESATTILDILKDGVSINDTNIDGVPVTTVTQRLRMISGRTPQLAGVVPPTGEEHGYFWPGLPGTATAHTRFSRIANLGPAPYTYSTVARVDLCALAIRQIGQRPSLKFKVQGELAASATVGAHPADVLLDLWERAGKDPADLDVESYYRAYVTGGGGSGSTGWRVNRTIDTQTSTRELMQALLDETFSTVVKKEDGTLLVVPRDVAVGGATALGVNDFLKGSGPLITVEMKQASDLFNCYPVVYEVTTETGTHQVTNEDTTFAVGTAPTFADAHPFSATETIRRAPPVNAKWVSTAEHALNLSHLLAEENFTVRGTYKFRLHKRWVLLQEGDLLSLTEPHLGVTAKVVRIARISEDASGVIEVEATEWFGQVAYTTPEVDPFDGFGTPQPGTPKDPNTEAIDAMADDGYLSPSEKPSFISIVTAIWFGAIEAGEVGGAGFPIHGGATTLSYEIAAFSDYLATLGYDFQWSDIDGNWSVEAARIYQRGLLEAWIAVPTVIASPDAFRSAFTAINSALASYRSSVLTSIASVVNTNAYGTVGDGVADDTAAIQSALDANAGGVVTLPAGNFLVTDTITVPADTTIVGLGSESQIWWEGTGSYNVGSGYGQAGTAGLLITGNGVVLKDFLIFGSGAESFVAGERCIAVVGASGASPVRDTRIVNVVARECGEAPILFSYANGFLVRDSRAESGGLYGIDVYASTNGRIHLNEVASIRPGDVEGTVPCASIHVVDSEDISVQMNTVRDWQDVGVSLSGNDGVQVQGNRVIELTPDSVGDATGILIAADDPKVLVSGNSVITGTGTQPDVGLDYSANDTNPVTIGANDFTDAVTPYSPGTATYADGLP